MNGRFIEVDFPIEEVGAHSAREKNIRRGHISGFHIWWARRPLGASRASIYAALTPAPKSEEERLRHSQLIADLAKWENSDNQRLLETAKRGIMEGFEGRAPKVLDCFAGGGAIPLEALRLGCETHSLDLNPVAVLIQKATLEYPQRYGDPDLVAKLRPARSEDRSGQRLALGKEGASLVHDVRYWGERVLEEARRDLAEFYPEGPDGSIPLGYIWARTIRCQNPQCGAEIPLMRQFWLASKRNRRVALQPVVNRQSKRVDFRVVRGDEIDFDPSEGTVRRANSTCLVCGSGVAAKDVRRQFQEGLAAERMVAVVLGRRQGRGKAYREATEQDMRRFDQAAAALDKKVAEWPWDLPPVPDEPLPIERVRGFSGFRILLYGMTTWGDLFNSRQKLSLVTFVEKVRRAHQTMLAAGYDPEYGKAILACLSLMIDRLADRNSALCRVIPQTEAIGFTFTRQALPMLWDYIEMNPFEHSSGWGGIVARAVPILASLSQFGSVSAEVRQGTATRLPYSDATFDAVITDPPYYDNVAYADLSDFFYVWLKRTVGEQYPGLFATPLAPKAAEVIQDAGRNKLRGFFEEMLTCAFTEMRRVLTPEGIAVIVFAHQSTDAWESVVRGLLDAGLVLNAAWPVHTEMRARLTAQETASLASSIYMVCRKRSEERVAYFNEIRPDIEERVEERLAHFWNAGIGGADFFISAIGAAVEVFGRYSRVERMSGEKVTVQELLEYLRGVVIQFSLNRVFKGRTPKAVDPLTLYYLVMRQIYGQARVHFDDARKMAQPMGVELKEHWGGGGLFRKDGSYIRVLGPEARAMHLLEGRRSSMGPDTPVIDVLHRCLLLWQSSDRQRIGETLMATGLASRDDFWELGQAIAEVLPEGDRERQLLQGLLYGRKEYERAAVDRGWHQTSLFGAGGKGGGR